VSDFNIERSEGPDSQQGSGQNPAHGVAGPLFLLVALLAIVATIAAIFSNDASAPPREPRSASAEMVQEEATTPEKPSVTAENRCSDIEIAIASVESLFAGDSASVGEATSVLRAAASIWRLEAQSRRGSEAAWLLKMAELGTSVSSYITTGEPSDGVLKLTQLENNMGLFSQFCE